MSTVIDSIEQRELKSRPQFAAGDRVRVHFQVVEGNRRRTQVFEGIVLKRQGSGSRETFTVRKNSFGVGVERTFPLHSPKIEQLEVAGRGDVRRAKLYYLRDKVGKSARVAERRWGISDELVVAPEEAEAVDAEGVSVAEAEPEVVEPEEPETEGESEQAETTQAPPQDEAAPEGDEAQSEAAPEGDQTEPTADAPEAEGGDSEPDAADAEGDGSSDEATD